MFYFCRINYMNLLLKSDFAVSGSGVGWRCFSLQRGKRSASVYRAHHSSPSHYRAAWYKKLSNSCIFLTIIVWNDSALGNIC